MHLDDIVLFLEDDCREEVEVAFEFRFHNVSVASWWGQVTLYWQG